MTQRAQPGTFFLVRLASSIALGFAAALCACSDGATASDALEDTVSDTLRIGRVHVVLEPRDDDEQNANPEAFEVTARFAWVRGLEEEFVRARADIPFLPDEVLSVGQCATEDGLWPEAQQELASEDASPELVLVDAGALEVGLGDTQLEIPLSLVPDLLPYMSGVEYVYFADEIPSTQALGTSLTVRGAGGQSDELPPFSAEGAIPSALELRFDEVDLNAAETGALMLSWAPGAGKSSEVSLSLTPTLRGEPVGDTVHCVAADQGQAQLDLTELQTLGFPLAADGVKVSASRTSYTPFDAGSFSGSELLVERRDSLDIPLR